MSLANKNRRKKDNLCALLVYYFLLLIHFLCEFTSHQVDILLYDTVKDNAKLVEDFDAASKMKAKSEKNKTHITKFEKIK